MVPPGTQDLPKINVAELVTKRRVIKGSLTRFQTFLQGIKSDDFDSAHLKRRLANFEVLLDKFESIQTDIEIADPSQMDTGERDEFESKYYDLLSQADKLLDPIVLSRPTNSVNFGSDGSLNQLRLPRIDLPVFAGDYDQWLPFFDTFHSLIHNNGQLSDIQKLHYLKSSLKGDAANMLQSLEISAQNYSVAWELLKERYDNKRMIIQKHIKAIFNTPVMNKESHSGLRTLIDGVQKHIRALKSLKRPVEHWDDILIIIITEKLDSNSNKEWESSLPKGQIPELSSLLNFLNHKLQTLELITKRPSTSYNSNATAGQIKRVIAHTTASNEIKCVLCSKNHTISSCESFLKLSIEDRMAKAREKSLCMNCLQGGHKTMFCRARKCKICNKRHNYLLHLVNNTLKVESSVPSPITTSINPVISNNSNCSKTKNVLLSTAIVGIIAKNGDVYECRALLDSGSQTNFITFELAKRLGLALNSSEVKIMGINRFQSSVTYTTQTEIKSRLNGFKAAIECLVLNKITEKIPLVTINIDNIEVPKGITLADPKFYESRDIDLLLGASTFWQILSAGQIKRHKDQPCFQKTLFGWLVSGDTPSPRPKNGVVCNLSLNNLEQSLNRFWQIDEVVTKNLYSPEEQACEDNFGKTYSRDSSGRFIVQLPFKADPAELGNTSQIALKRFYNVERKLQNYPALNKQYCEFLKEYLELGHMSLCEDTSKEPNFYLPHHAVMKDTSLTTKLRVVFDASAKSSNGISLNDMLLTGPTIQQSLFAILTRYRTHKYVLNADITKMYRQILIDKGHWQFHRILWRFNPSEEVKTYELRTVTYGTAPASFLATRCLKQVAMDNQDKFPIAAKLIKRDFYMDDLLTGASNIPELIKIRDQVTEVLNDAGFKLRKFVSNDERILSGIPPSSDDNLILDLDRVEGIKTLGLQWHARHDIFKFSIKPETESKRTTKRTILSEVAQMFDPLGLISPVTISAKILIQRLWQLQLAWDEALPLELHSNWERYRQSLINLNQLGISRSVMSPEGSAKVEMHGFCDASQMAYGAAIYIRSLDFKGEWHSHLLCAKSRVAPLKTLSIPRLELCGAVLLVDLVYSVCETINLDINKIFYWSDSSIVLAWIRAPSRNFNVFVGNRTGHIQRLTNVENWHHVTTDDNPADLISRGVSPDQIINNEFWWFGPKWLKLDRENWPKPVVPVVDHLSVPEIKKSILAHTVIQPINDFEQMCSKYSSLSKLIRITAYCLRFIENIRGKGIRLSDRKVGNLSGSELRNAENFLIKTIQNSQFSEELAELKESGKVSKRSKTIALAPFLDKEGLIRVGGRLSKALAPYDARHPVLLPSKHPFTNLLIVNEHVRLLHAGNMSTLASIRQNFWILAARDRVRQILKGCIVCFKARPQVLQPLMADLPASRTKPTRPFSVCGVDFFGPVMIKEGSRKSKITRKAYGAIFVCFATRAVHLELVSELTTSAFLATLKRFIARRGMVAHIYSDNGKNFLGAKEKLSEMSRLASQSSEEFNKCLGTKFNGTLFRPIHLILEVCGRQE